MSKLVCMTCPMAMTVGFGGSSSSGGLYVEIHCQRGLGMLSHAKFERPDEVGIPTVIPPQAIKAELEKNARKPLEWCTQHPNKTQPPV